MTIENEGTPGLIEGTQPAEFLEYDFGVASTGTDQIALLFRLTDGPWKGREVTWFGTFTEAAIEYTLEALANVGWDGKDVRTMKDALKRGTRVNLVFATEEYNGETRSRPRFINKAGIRFGAAGPMSKEQRNGFLRELQERLGASAVATGAAGRAFIPKGKDDDIPF